MPERNRGNGNGTPGGGRDDADERGVNENPMSAAEEPRAETGGGTAFGARPGRATPRKVTPKRAAAKKTAGGEGGATAKKAPAKKAVAKKTAAKAAGAKQAAPAKRVTAKKAAPRKAAVKGGAAKKAAPKTVGAKRVAGKTAGKAAGKTTTAKKAAGRSRTSGTSNGKLGSLPPGQVARDYSEAKRALSTLWEDVTKQTYSAFNTIAGRVEKNFNEARRNINEMDVRYALEKTQNKLKTVAKSGQQSAQQLGRQARLLYQMLKDAVAGRFRVPWATVSAVTAALLYFISPLDILPDFIPGAGLIDDALVISMAVSLARMDLRRYLQENDLSAEEYGL